MVVILTSSDAGFQIDDVGDVEGPGCDVGDVKGPGCGVGDVEGPGCGGGDVEGPGCDVGDVEGPGCGVGDVEGPGCGVGNVEGPGCGVGDVEGLGSGVASCDIEGRLVEAGAGPLVSNLPFIAITMASSLSTRSVIQNNNHATIYQQTLPYIAYIKELQIDHCKTTASIKLVVVAMAVFVNITNILA